MQITFPMEPEQLEELAKELSRDELAQLGRLQQDAHFASLVSRYKEAAPDVMDLFIKMSEQGFVEQTIDVNDSISLKVRTLSSWMYDESQETSYKTGVQLDLCARAHARRCFAYALAEVSGKQPAGTSKMPEASYFVLDDEGNKMLKTRADKVESYLARLPEAFYNLLQMHRAAWDTAIMETVRSSDMSAAAKK